MAIVDAWYRKHSWPRLLWPLSLLYRWLTLQRRRRLERTRVPHPQYPPVLIVGNITVGGTGKTPLVIAIARLLQENGIRPAIISRGYGGSAPEYPYALTSSATVDEAGDEAILIARSVDCPMLVDRQRVRALARLHEEGRCDVILSDDGLQHYALERAVEIVVIDAARMFGNGLCLPAGPLREPPARLQEVDFIVFNGDGADVPLSVDGPLQTCMHLRPRAWVNLHNRTRVALDALPVPPGARLHAIAGIGNPQRFFNTLQGLGYDALCHPFPDHYRFSEQDLRFAAGNTIVMTGKDAVKCETFASEQCWYLDLEVELDPLFSIRLLALVHEKIAAVTNLNKKE